MHNSLSMLRVLVLKLISTCFLKHFCLSIYCLPKRSFEWIVNVNQPFVKCMQTIVFLNFSSSLEEECIQERRAIFKWLTFIKEPKAWPLKSWHFWQTIVLSYQRKKSVHSLLEALYSVCVCIMLFDTAPSCFDMNASSEISMSHPTSQEKVTLTFFDFDPSVCMTDCSLGSALVDSSLVIH